MCALVACTRCPITLRIAPGERVALVGANGSGKSTLLRLLHGLVPASAGTCVTALPQQQAMLFQRPHMLRTSAQNNVALGLWLRGSRWGAGPKDGAGRTAAGRRWIPLHRQNAAPCSRRAAAACGTGPCLGAAARCVAAGRAHVQPGPHAKREVERMMADFANAHAEQGRAQPVTMLFSSHNLGQVKRLASRVIYLEHGQLVADLPVHDFFNGPLPEAARLFVKGELV